MLCAAVRHLPVNTGTETYLHISVKGRDTHLLRYDMHPFHGHDPLKSQADPFAPGRDPDDIPDKLTCLQVQEPLVILYAP